MIVSSDNNKDSVCNELKLSLWTFPNASETYFSMQTRFDVLAVNCFKKFNIIEYIYVLFIPKSKL